MGHTTLFLSEQNQIVGTNPESRNGKMAPLFKKYVFTFLRNQTKNSWFLDPEKKYWFRETM